MSNASTIELFARLAVSLAVVIGLMWAVAALLRRRGLGPGPRAATRPVTLELLARRPLGRNAAIAVVRTGGRALVIGITDHQVTRLGEADLEEIDLETADGHRTADPQGPASPATAWRAMLEQVRERTIRR